LHVPDRAALIAPPKTRFVPRFITPTAEQIRSVLRESHALWGAGLSVADYVGMWEELADSRWGRAWYSWRALVDEQDRVVTSLKLYRPMLRLGHAVGRACAIGAVFTPRAFRRRGLAASLIRATCDEARERGDASALLFTDIGTEYYRSLGFSSLPCEDAIGSLPGALSAAARGVTFRSMTPDDIDAVASAHDAACARLPIAVMRDRDHWEFLLLRAATFFRRLDHSGLEHRFMIAMEASRPIGYLVAVLGPGEWNLRDAEAFDGDPATLARLLESGAAQARAAGATTVWGWIPRATWPLVPAWRLRSQPRLRAIPMIAALDGGELGARLDTVERAFIPYLDQF
jgi:GNAT superfamily N-acetyltransferase